MPKTLDDYLSEPELANEPSALREVHAIRLKIYDEIKDMTVAERTAYFSGPYQTFPLFRSSASFPYGRAAEFKNEVSNNRHSRIQFTSTSKIII